jgi:hypothetical protein
MEGKGGLSILSQESADAQASPQRAFPTALSSFPFPFMHHPSLGARAGAPRRLFIAPIPTKIL